MRIKLKCMGYWSTCKMCNEAVKLVMDFTTKTGTCYKNSKGTIELATAFQLIRERLVNDNSKIIW